MPYRHFQIVHIHQEVYKIDTKKGMQNRFKLVDVKKKSFLILYIIYLTTIKFMYDNETAIIITNMV